MKSSRPAYHLNNLEQILLPSVNVVSFDSKAACVCGRLRAELEENGQPLDLADLEIASIVIAEDLILITGNIRYFLQNRRVETRKLAVGCNLRSNLLGKHGILNGIECRYMLGAEGNEKYRLKTIKYKDMLVIGKNLPFGTIFSSSSIHRSPIKSVNFNRLAGFSFRFRPKKSFDFRRMKRV